MTDDLIFRLKKRAEIRRNIPSRKSVILGEPDKLSNLLEEAGKKLENLSIERDAYKRALTFISEPYWELSHDKIRLQRDEYKKVAIKVLDEYWIEDNPVEEQKPFDDNF